jgi:UDP-3-O-[3-hydroxymyristoyl] glucosamine N-acyltransferase
VKTEQGIHAQAVLAEKAKVGIGGHDMVGVVVESSAAVQQADIIVTAEACLIRPI